MDVVLKTRLQYQERWKSPFDLLGAHLKAWEINMDFVIIAEFGKVFLGDLGRILWTSSEFENFVYFPPETWLGRPLWTSSGITEFIFLSPLYSFSGVWFDPLLIGAYLRLMCTYSSHVSFIDVPAETNDYLQVWFFQKFDMFRNCGLECNKKASDTLTLFDYSNVLYIH